MALQTKTVQTGDYAWKSWSNAYVISLKLTEESVDIAANTSKVSYLFTISNTNNNRFIDYNFSWNISIGNQQIPIKNFNFNLGSDYTTQTIASGQLTVPHNADGKLQMPYQVSIPDVQSGNRYGPPAMSLSGTWELTVIPRIAAISCPEGTIGKPVAISIQGANGERTHTITYKFGQLTGTVTAATTQSQVSWTIPTAFYSQIPTTKRGSGTLTCTAYNGNTYEGQSTCTFYANIDEADSVPALSPLVQDENPLTVALTGDPNTLIRYHSDVCVQGNCSGKNGASITEYKMSHNGKAYTEQQVTISAVEIGRFDFAATDSRGLSATVQVIKPVIPYIQLTCNVENSKTDPEGNMPLSVSGNYFAGSFGAENNTLTLQYRYKVKNASWSDTAQWYPMEPVIGENCYTAQTIVTGLNHQKLYTFQVRAVDRVAEAEGKMYSAKATPVFDWGETDFAIHGDLSVDGKLTMENIPVLNTPHIHTYYWNTEGGVSLQSVVDFMATCTRNCGFLVMIRGTDHPFEAVAVGLVYGGKYGAFTLYDYLNGAQSRRVYNSVLHET